MAVLRVVFHQFRNIAEAEIHLSPQLTLLVGANGQGKTNILEGVYLLLQGRSFRTVSEREAIQDGGDSARLEAHGDIAGRPTHWTHWITPQRRSHQGPIIPVVLFAPEDVYLAKGSPDRRRRFLDLLLSAHDAHYARSLKAYQRALLQRNRALKQQSLRRVVDDFTPLLAHEGLYLWQQRRAVIASLLPLAQSLHHRMAGTDLLTFALKEGGWPQPIDTVEAFLQALATRRHEEEARQMTLIGPHRDDIFFTLNGKDTTVYASQGQLRTIALSLKLATYQWLFEETGIRPIVLLDDVLSELDSSRRQAVLELTAQPGQQTLVTDTEPRNYQLLNPTIYFIQGGRVR
ncbi:MAG: DNA replication and repair protein RecF [Firmicutes bacterium]|nr:DNA replication and repair protein RecF [Bacillota bacterium]